MKLKINHLLFISIVLQIISTQGVLTFLGFNFLGYWELKTILHPLSFSLTLFFFYFKSF